MAAKAPGALPTLSRLGKTPLGVGFHGPTNMPGRLRSLLDDYWNHSGGITVDEAQIACQGSRFRPRTRPGFSFENARNSVVVAKADLRGGKVNRILLAEEIQHGLDRATSEASKAIRRGLTNEQFHAQLFQRIVDGYAAGKFHSLPLRIWPAYAALSRGWARGRHAMQVEVQQGVDEMGELEEFTWVGFLWWMPQRPRISMNRAYPKSDRVSKMQG